jgi:hypothetical protein
MPDWDCPRGEMNRYSSRRSCPGYNCRDRTLPLLNLLYVLNAVMMLAGHGEISPDPGKVDLRMGCSITISWCSLSRLNERSGDDRLMPE